jgi:hypothetical protein
VIRLFSVILLLTAFAAQTFNAGFIQLGYYINPAAFAKYCVNKAKPKMHCNGKCQVMKKMQEDEKKQQENQSRKWDNKITVLSSKSFFCTIDCKAIPVLKPAQIQNVLLVKDISLSVFHPPQI